MKEGWVRTYRRTWLMREAWCRLVRRPSQAAPYTPRCCTQQASPGDFPQRQVQQGIAQRLQVVPRPRPLALWFE